MGGGVEIDSKEEEEGGGGGGEGGDDDDYDDDSYDNDEDLMNFLYVSLQHAHHPHHHSALVPCPQFFSLLLYSLRFSSDRRACESRQAGDLMSPEKERER